MISPQSGSASVVWLENNTPHINVFFQATDNYVWMDEYDGSKWNSAVQLFQAQPNTSLSAICWGSGSSRQIRIYYQDQSSRLMEFCYNNGWKAGATMPP